MSTAPNVPSRPAGSKSGIMRKPFGIDREGHPVECFTLRNATGAEVEVLSLGGIIRALRVPDRAGVMADVVLGFDDVASYQPNPSYLGALIGRYGNRIAGGRFAVDGATYPVSRNDGANTLHGGESGFDTRHWQVEPTAGGQGVGLALRLTSADGDQGFPGELHVDVTYTWRDDCALVVGYRATTTATTPLNLTQHSYFNLSGVPGTAVLDHELSIHASRYTPVDTALIPSGELSPVAGTPFDFRTSRCIGERIHAPDVQLGFGQGYDHNWVLDGFDGAPIEGAEPVEAARLFDPGSGRLLVISTTEPGLQVYSGNHLGTGRIGKGGVPVARHGGVALETQHFPDSPNQPAFPDTLLRPGRPFASTTIWAFGIVPDRR